MLEYTAQMAWHIASAVYGIGGVEFTIPSYMEIAYPEASTRDNRTAEQIIQDTLDGLG